MGEEECTREGNKEAVTSKEDERETGVEEVGSSETTGLTTSKEGLDWVCGNQREKVVVKEVLGSIEKEQPKEDNLGKYILEI